MGGGPPDFPQGFSCLVVLRIPLAHFDFHVRGYHPYCQLSQYCSISLHVTCCGPLPRNARIPVWALPISLATTLGIDVSFSSSGYLDVSVPRVPLHTLWIGVWILEVFSSRFPHSEISGSQDICSSPKLFAAYHVFHRLSVPRHPPYALSCLTSNTWALSRALPICLHLAWCIP